MSLYISRHPVSLKKILYEPTKGRVIYHTKYNDYFKKKQKSVWARLIQKVFAVNPLECSKCGSEMAIKAFIFDKESLDRIAAWMIQRNKLEWQTNKSLPMTKLMTALGLFFLVFRVKVCVLSGIVLGCIDEEMAERLNLIKDKQK